MHLHRIDPFPSLQIRRACEQEDVVREVVQATPDLYQRKGLLLPWAGDLAEFDGRFVGTCGFAGPPVDGEAEIAYFTFPGNEGQGIARRMAEALISLTRARAAATTFIAHTLPSEGPSTTILQRLGFESLGLVQHPEDGPIWKWRERVRPGGDRVATAPQELSPQAASR